MVRRPRRKVETLLIWWRITPTVFPPRRPSPSFLAAAECERTDDGRDPRTFFSLADGSDECRARQDKQGDECKRTRAHIDEYTNTSAGQNLHRQAILLC